VFYIVGAFVSLAVAYGFIKGAIQQTQQNDRYAEAQRDRVRQLAQRGDITHERYE
jgi:hypothetical protein